MSGQIIGPIGVLPTTVGAPVFTPTANPAIQNVAFAGTVVTFPSIAIGAASADRIVIIGVSNIDNIRVINSIDVGGTGLVRGVSASGGTANTGCEFWYGNVTSGTSVTVTVTYSAAPSLVGILVGILTGQAGGGIVTPSATNGKPTDSVSDPQAFASGMTVPTGGLGIVFSLTQTPGAAASWTNTTAGAGDYWVTLAAGLNIALAHTITTGSWSPTVSNMGTFSGNSMVALAFNQ